MRKLTTFLGIGLIGLSVVNCGGGTNPTTSTSEPQQINLSTSGESQLVSQYFSLTTTGESQPNFGTTVSLAYESGTQSLDINFINTNDQFVGQNQYSQDNTAMWNQEVFEIFISAGTSTPTEYIQVDVDPNGEITSGLVTNPYGTGINNTYVFIDSGKDHISHEIESSIPNNSWSGNVSIPLTMLGGMQNNYRINFTRIVSTQDHSPLNQNDQWKCTVTSCVYLSWMPTFSGNVPAFHIPKYFAQLNLQN